MLEYATRLGRAVVTLNWQDFLALHLRDPAHAGIVVCEADPDPSALASRIDQHLAAHANLAGAVVEVAR